MKNPFKPFKKSWIIFGVIILVWTLFWFVKVSILNNYEVVINVILLVIGYCLLINYILITAVYWAIKRLKKEWEIRD
jgi:purine-cytosine permease-like protein